MKKGLVHIKKQYDPDDKEYYDISDDKIYYDSTTGQCKHKFVCGCGNVIGCYCFDDVESALSASLEGMCCLNCGIYNYLSDNLYEDAALQNLIDELEGTRFFDAYNRRRKLDLSYFDRHSDELWDLRWDAIEEQVHKMMGIGFSYETLTAINSYLINKGYYDCDFAGSACTA